MSNTAVKERPATNGNQPAPSKAVAGLPPWDKPTSLDTLKLFTGAVVGQVDRSLPHFLAGHGERLVRCLFTCCQKTPSLLNCTPLSLFGGVIQAGQLGLELGGPLGQAYLIPYGKEATFVLGYKGAISLAFRSAMLRHMTPCRVRAGDRFEVHEGTGRHIVHVPLRNNRAPVTDYYVTSTITNGGQDFEVFTYEEALEFRERYSSTRNAPDAVKRHSPWYDDREGLGWNGFDWMAAKTLMKRLGKRLPVSVEFQTAIALDDSAEFDGPQDLGRNVHTGEPEPNLADNLRGKLDAAKAGAEGGNGGNGGGAAEPTPLQSHAKAIEESDTEQELDGAYQAACADKALSKSDRPKITTLRDSRLKALKAPPHENGDPDRDPFSGGGGES